MSEQVNSPDAGSEKSIDRDLYEWASRDLHRFITSRLTRAGQGGNEAQELLSVVFERYWKSRHTLIRNPEAYLIRITENVVNEFLLQRSRSVVTFDSTLADTVSSEMPQSSIWGDQTLDKVASDQQLHRVLAQVRPMYRAVLLLSIREGMSDEQVAKKLGITVSTARAYFIRGLAACRAADWNR